VNKQAMLNHRSSGIHSVLLKEGNQSVIISAVKLNPPVTVSSIEHGGSSVSGPPLGQPRVGQSGALLRGDWSIIPESQYHKALEALEHNIHAKPTLSKHGHFKGTGSVSAYRMQAPQPSRGKKRRAAVAVDCEMVGIYGNRSELARLSAIDYLTGEVLIDRLVKPDAQVTNWRSDVSGITKGKMNSAIAAGRALRGWKAAQVELWKYVDSETILVGQALKHDLAVLRMTHARIVDSAILTAEAVGLKGGKQWGLKTLCKDLLARTIQGTSHDSVQDALAAREVVLWCLNNPVAFQEWARKAKEIEVLFRAQQAAAARTRALQNKVNRLVDLEDCFSGVHLWEDLAEEFEWPHPDTGYYPWSD
jgi:DNA polymerase III epsilon subunit-like protein